MTEPIATDSPFTPAELGSLKILAGMIIPASPEHGIPGANDEVIFADIARSARDNEDAIHAAIAFAEGQQQPPTLKLEDSTPQLEGRMEMAAVVALVVQCYYRDDRVMASLGMEPRAPFPQGFSLEQSDWEMLEPVAQRGQLWRDPDSG